MPSRITELAARGDWEGFAETGPSRIQILNFLEMSSGEACNQAGTWLLDCEPTLEELLSIARCCCGLAKEDAESDLLNLSVARSEVRQQILSSSVSWSEGFTGQLLKLCESKDLLWALKEGAEGLRDDAYEEAVEDLDIRNPELLDLYKEMPPKYQVKVIEDKIIGQIGVVSIVDLLELAQPYENSFATSKLIEALLSKAKEIGEEAGKKALELLPGKDYKQLRELFLPPPDSSPGQEPV